MVSSPLQDKPKVRWYFKPAMIIVSILAVGPLAIPLIWLSPELKYWHKIALTVITVILTVLLLKATFDLFAILTREFQSLNEALK